MMFWIAVAALAAAVTYAVTRPLAGDARDSAAIDQDAAAADLAVYKDQLTEIGADYSRGAISAIDADAASAEVARRIIRRSDDPRADATTRSTGIPSRGLSAAYVAASMLLPLGSLGLYLAFGAPGLPGQPLTARLEAPIDVKNHGDLIAKVEGALRANPQDGKGWDVIAPVYAAQGRFDDAASAFASAMRLLGENAARLQGFADARMRAANGLIGDDARKALERLRTLAPEKPEPRIWLALAKEQEGDIAVAIDEYRAILADGPTDAPWRKSLTDRIASLEQGAKSAGAPRDPAASDVAAFEAMTPEQRAAKINEMVDGLAAKLKAQPKDLNGWQRLIRAYAAMGRRDDALKAAAEARAGLSGDDAQINELDAWIKQIGLAG